MLKGCQKAILSVSENIVEGLTGHPRTTDHRTNREPRISNVPYYINGSLDNAAALNLNNPIPREPPTAEARVPGKLSVHLPYPRARLARSAWTATRGSL